jgi:hypothetical protein
MVTFDEVAGVGENFVQQKFLAYLVLVLVCSSAEG